MGIGALRRHRNRHEASPEVAATPAVEPVTPTSVTPEQLAKMREDAAFEAAYQEELAIAEAAEKEAAEQAAADKEENFDGDE